MVYLRARTQLEVGMRKAAEPNVSFSARIDLETDRRRRKLQRTLKCSTPDLIRRALHELEMAVKGERAVHPAEATAQ
jgi:hypothetical protein